MSAGPRSYLLFAVLVLVLLAALTWANYQFTLENPGGNDFLPRWLGTRMFLLEGQSPYSPETTNAIQTLIYGRHANLGEDAALFAYPHYSMLIFAPFAAIGDYALARAAWMTLLEASALLVAVFSLAALGWHPSRGLLLAVLVFSVAWYHAARTLINGNAALLVALLMVLVLYMIISGSDGMAGIALALSTIKPQMVLLFIVFLLLWAFYHVRYRFLIAFAITWGGVVLMSTLIQPDWLAAELNQVLTYPGYAPPGSPIEIFSTWWGTPGLVLGVMVALASIAFILRSWLPALRSESKSAFLYGAGLTLIAANFSGIPTTTTNYAAMLPGLVMVLHELTKRPRGKLTSVILLSGLLVGLWLLFILTLGGGAQFREHSVMFLPTPLALLAFFLWLRPQAGEAA